MRIVELQEASSLLLNGLIGVIPTDTVYGVVAVAKNRQAIDKLYKLKDRQGKPGTLLAVNTEQLIELGLDKASVLSASSYWPNPISIILPAPSDLHYLHQGVNTLAVRLPDNKNLQMLLKLTGPLMSSSANPPGMNPAVNIEVAQEYFGEQVDFYVDGGDLAGKEASTIAKFENDQLSVIRQGAYRVKD